MNGHALLSASGAKRWLNCPRSARLEAELPEETSNYAEEGTLAHAIAELHLRRKFAALATRTFNAELKKLKSAPLFQPEMLRHVECYTDRISELVHSFAGSPHIAIEQRTDYDDLAPEGFGTCDCVIIGADTLHIVDFKYGKGVPVDATENPQMRLYAWGILKAYRMLYSIKTVRTHIIQPRLDNFSSETLTVEDLERWGASVKPIAEKAYMGFGEFNPGDHCRFCRAKAVCRARCNQFSALQDFGFLEPALMAREEVAKVLGLAKELYKWVSDLEEWALAEALSGNGLPGWKAVEGRSLRQFKDTDAALQILIGSGFDKDLLFERKPLSLAKLEDLVGKKQFSDLMKDHIEKAPGKPTLVPESDKREAIKRITAEQDFMEVKVS